MSFDRYFDSTKDLALLDDASDDWYAIVEQALHAADLVSYRNPQQLEMNLMKALPVIPEDDMDEPPVVVSVGDWARRLGSVYSTEAQTLNPEGTPNDANISVQEGSTGLQDPGQVTASRRRSSVYSIDFDHPLSLESSALETWTNDVCSDIDSTMGSLRTKAFARPSGFTGSAVSSWSVSVGSSSSMGGRPPSMSSSVYSTDASTDSNGSPVRSDYVRSRKMSSASSQQARLERRAITSFFDFSDDEGEKEEVSVARPQSSASSYVRHLRSIALSLRMATSKIAQARVKTVSIPPGEAPPLRSSWLFHSSLLHGVSSSRTSEETILEGKLVTGAAESAKAKRVLGLR